MHIQLYQYLLFLNFSWVPGSPPKDLSLSQPSLQLGGDIWLSLDTSRDDVCHFLLVPLKGKGCVLPFLSPVAREMAGAQTTAWTHRKKQLVSMAELSSWPWTFQLWTICEKNHWIIQLHYKKWRVEFTAQHLLTVKYLKQQLSLWTVCRPAVRMFLSNYRKNYATTSVSFQYLRSVVDNILRNLSWTLVYIWSVYI